MSARPFKLALALFVVGILASCSWMNRPITRPLVYNVREATVIANANVPLRIIEGVDRRVSDAIRATRPPAGAERVVVVIRIDKLGYGFNARRKLQSATFTVTAASVETGDPVATGTFTVNSPTDDPVMAEESLAEEIASRVRFAFSLASPTIRKVVLPPRTTSTRLMTDPAPRASVVPQASPTAPLAAAPAAVPPPSAAEVSAVPDLGAVPVAPASAMKSNVEEGASGSVALGKKAVPCDPANDPTCEPHKP